MGVNMGLGPLGKESIGFKRKFRYEFRVEGFIGYKTEVLFPLKGGRPNLNFKEIEAPHIYENIYYHGKPEWKPLQWTLYEHCPIDNHPIFEWIKRAYNPEYGNFWPAEDNQFKQTGRLEILDGCGNTIEKWKFDNMWPQTANFGEVDYGNSEVITCDVTFRYDRAYLINT